MTLSKDAGCTSSNIFCLHIISAIVLSVQHLIFFLSDCKLKRRQILVWSSCFCVSCLEADEWKSSRVMQERYFSLPTWNYQTNLLVYIFACHLQKIPSFPPYLTVKETSCFRSVRKPYLFVLFIKPSWRTRNILALEAFWLATIWINCGNTFSHTHLVRQVHVNLKNKIK